MPRQNWTRFLLVRRDLEFRTQKFWDTWIQLLPLHTCTQLHLYVLQSNLIITLPRKHVKTEPVSLSRHPQNVGRKKQQQQQTHLLICLPFTQNHHQTQPTKWPSGSGDVLCHRILRRRWSFRQVQHGFFPTVFPDVKGNDVGMNYYFGGKTLPYPNRSIAIVWS